MLLNRMPKSKKRIPKQCPNYVSSTEFMGMTAKIWSEEYKGTPQIKTMCQEKLLKFKR